MSIHSRFTHIKCANAPLDILYTEKFSKLPTRKRKRKKKITTTTNATRFKNLRTSSKLLLFRVLQTTTVWTVWITGFLWLVLEWDYFVFSVTYLIYTPITGTFFRIVVESRCCCDYTVFICGTPVKLLCLLIKSVVQFVGN